MLPEIVSNNHASLQPGKTRFARTCWIEFTPDGVPVHAEVERSAIRSVRRFAYEEVDVFLADPDTRDEATAKFGRLMAGEIAEYQTYGTILDVWGEPVSLRFTVRLRPDLAPDGPHLEVAWHDINLPAVSDGARSEEHTSELQSH